MISQQQISKSPQSQPTPTIPLQDPPPPPQKKMSFVPFLIVGVIVALVLATGGVFLLGDREKTSNTPTSNQPQLLSDYGFLGNNKLVYLRYKNLYLLDKSGSKLLVKDKDVSAEFKVSPDGNYIAWYNKTKNTSWFDSVSLYVYDRSTNQVREVVNTQGPHIFSFLPSDPNKIVFQRNGIWIKDIKTDKEEKILDNPRKNDGFNKFTDFTVSPLGENLIAVDECITDCSREVLVYNFKSKQGIKLVDVLSAANSNLFVALAYTGKGGAGDRVWLDDNSLIAYSYSRSGNPFLYLISIKDLTATPLIDEKYFVHSFFSAAYSKNKGLVVSIEPWKTEEKDDDLPLDGPALYAIDLNGNIKLIKSTDAYDLQWSPDDNLTYRTYIESNKESDLKILIDNGSNITLVSGVQAYSWLPFTE